MWKNTGFDPKKADVPAAMQLLHRFVEEIPGKYRAFSQGDLRERPAPGKWSRQEILGHLVDSALNNLKRFTDIQVMPQPYHVQRYMQDALVEVNDYQQLPLQHLLHTWEALNRQIIYVADRIPPAKLSLPLVTTSGETKTLEWLIIDYVVHMEHHWRNVFR